MWGPSALVFKTTWFSSNHWDVWPHKGHRPSHPAHCPSISTSTLKPVSALTRQKQKHSLSLASAHPLDPLLPRSCSPRCKGRAEWPAPLAQHCGDRERQGSGAGTPSCCWDTALLSSATQVCQAPGNGVYEGWQQRGGSARNHCLIDTAIKAKTSSNIAGSCFHLREIRFICHLTICSFQTSRAQRGEQLQGTEWKLASGKKRNPGENLQKALYQPAPNPALQSAKCSHKLRWWCCTNLSKSFWDHRALGLWMFCH